MGSPISPYSIWSLARNNGEVSVSVLTRLNVSLSLMPVDRLWEPSFPILHQPGDRPLMQWQAARDGLETQARPTAVATRLLPLLLLCPQATVSVIPNSVWNTRCNSSNSCPMRSTLNVSKSMMLLE